MKSLSQANMKFSPHGQPTGENQERSTSKRKGKTHCQPKHGRAMLSLRNTEAATDVRDMPGLSMTGTRTPLIFTFF